MRWTIYKQILLGYAIPLVCILVFGVVTFEISLSLADDFSKSRQVARIIDDTNQVFVIAMDAETGQRGYVITGADRYLEPYNRSVNNVDNALATLKSALKGSSSASHYDDLDTNIRAKMEELKQTVDLRRASGFQAALDVVITDRGKAAMDKIRESLNDIVQEQEAALDAGNQQITDEERTLTIVVVGGVALCVAAMLVFGTVTARGISRPTNEIAAAAKQIASGVLTVDIQEGSKMAEEILALAASFRAMVVSLRNSSALSERIAAGDLTVEVKPQSEADTVGKSQSLMVERLSGLIEQVQRSGVQVNSSAVQIAATTREQQSTASEMASTTTEISTTAKEMSATSGELLKSVDHVNTISQQLSGLAGNGKEGLGRMEQIMRQIMEASTSITNRLGELNDKASNISSVITTITKIADQTNLLSLNAAIEAEKAGEYGKGFSVVASEIRRLADQTATSTLDIEQMVREMLGAVSAGVMGMDKFSEEVRRSVKEVADVSRQLDQMIERVQSLTPSIESVFEGMRAQTQGSSQISEALAQLGDAARQTAEAVRDSHRAVEQLNEATKGLQSGISRFKLR